MSLQRLIVAAEQIVGSTVRLTPEQQHYLYRVLRLRADQQFIALDGKGSQWIAALTKKHDTAAIIKVNPMPALDEPAQISVTLAIAIPKGGGFDEVVRQTTELGVTTLQPVLTERTLHRPNPKKLERWKRIAAEATEQSERLWMPDIEAPLPWDNFVRSQAEGKRYLCIARQSAPHLLSQLQGLDGDDEAAALTIAIGPEGGWTPTEIDLALGFGFLPVSLGPAILRAVTAPLAALAIARAVNHSRKPDHT